MGSTDSVDELSVGELETLLFQKRRSVTEQRVQRFFAAECVLVQARALDDGELGEIETLRSPESWRGTRGQDRYFRSCALTPIGQAKRMRGPTLLGQRPRAPQSSNGGDAAAPTGSLRTQDSPSVTGARRWRGVLLLSAEILALVGFLVILGNAYLRLQALNREAREALRGGVPTPASEATPTSPPATAVKLLPGARPVDDARLADGARPAPPGLRAIARVAVPMAVPPTPGPGAPRRMVIPKIGVDAPVVAGDTWEDLKKGIGHHPGSASPGESGNMVAAAHNDIFGEIFRDLLELEPGDEVLVYTDEGAFLYIINKVEIVLPTKVEVMDPTDHPVLTLITCYPYLLDTHRIVAVADLAE